MASTYTPKDVQDLVTQFLHGIPLDKVFFQSCDMANSLIWRSFFWRWSIADFPAVTCLNDTQDYSNALPADFYRFRVCLLARTDLSPNEFRELDEKEYIGKELSRMGGLNDIKVFSILPETSGIRLELPTNISSPVTLQIQGEYQKQPTKITEGSIETAFAFPDQYFNVIVEGVKYYCYKLADDPRAGEVQVNIYGQRQYTGQLAQFMASLREMTEKEDISAGQTSRFPQDPIGWTRASNPGLFGF